MDGYMHLFKLPIQSVASTVEKCRRVFFVDQPAPLFEYVMVMSE